MALSLSGLVVGHCCGCSIFFFENITNLDRGFLINNIKKRRGQGKGVIHSETNLNSGILTPLAGIVGFVGLVWQQRTMIATAGLKFHS